MKLSRSVTYALKAALQLAQNQKGRPMPCSRIASLGAMPERFLLQILRSLVTHGILKSTRGVDGGYVLLKAANEISLLDVIEAIEGPMRHEIIIGEGMSDRSREKLCSVFDQVTQATLETLSAVKLADLIFDETQAGSSVNESPQVRANSVGIPANRIDAPSTVPQTPHASPPIVPATANPIPSGDQGSVASSNSPTDSSKSVVTTNVIGSSDSLPNVHPNSGAGV